MGKFRKLFSCVVIISLVCGPPSTSFSQQRGAIGGMVFTEAGAPSAGVGILVNNTAGETVTRAITDESGAYLIQDLPLGQYNMTLDPLMTNVKGDTIVADLGAEGLTVNWTVSASAPALVAKTSPAPHQDQQPWTTNQKIALAGLGTLITGGVVTSSLALAGFFHEPLEPAALVARVFDDNGNPVQGAEVTLRGSFGTCTTGGDGTCAIRDFRFESDSAELEIVVTDANGMEHVITTTIDVTQQNGTGSLADSVNSNDQQLALNVSLQEDPVTGEITGDVVVRTTDHGEASALTEDGGTGQNSDGTTVVDVEAEFTPGQPVSPSI
jgi:hypothetical protein